MGIMILRVARFPKLLKWVPEMVTMLLTTVVVRIWDILIALGIRGATR